MDQQFETINVDVSKKAYKKAFLHACKYPNEDVLGVLIGKIDKSYEIVDVYPLSHTRISLNTLEIALDLIQANIFDSKIIGIYESRANPSGIMSEIANELLNNLSQKQTPILMKISQIEKDDKQILIAKFLSQKEDQKFIINQASQLEWTVIEEALKQGLHWQIIDFDAHFENAHLDFRNKFLE